MATALSQDLAASCPAEARASLELELECAHAFTLWKAATPVRTVWLFRAEGADINEQAASAFLRALEYTVGALPPNARQSGCDFATFYDLSRLPLNFAPWALQLAGEVRRVRAQLRPARTVVFCNSAPARGLLRCVLDAVGNSPGPNGPFVLVDSLEQGWNEALAPAVSLEHTATAATTATTIPVAETPSQI